MPSNLDTFFVDKSVTVVVNVDDLLIYAWSDPKTEYLISCLQAVGISISCESISS